MKTGNLDGQGLAELRNYKFQMLASAPTPSEAIFYYDTTLKSFRYYNGSKWVDGTDFVAGNGIDSTALANGTIQVSTTVASKTDIGAGSVVFQKNGTALTTVNVNQTSTTTVNYTIPTQASDIGALPDTTTIGAANTVIQKNGTAIGTINANGTVDGTINISTTDGITIAAGSTNYLTYDSSTGQIGAKVDTTVTTSSTNLITSGAVQTAINNAISGGMVYKGVWTATGQTDYSSITLPVKAGYMYLVSGSATIGGIEWNTDDYLVINADVAVGGTITDVKKIDNTEGSDIVRLNATQTVTNKTIDADDNTISDLTTSNFKSGTVITSISSSSTDATLPTGAAVWNAVTTSISALSYSETNGALTQSGGVCTWTVTHNLNNSNVIVSVYEVSTGDKVLFDATITSANVVTIKILSASNISAGTYKAVVQG